MIPPTSVRAHTRTALANPYLTCDQCRYQVTHVHDGTRCGCVPAGAENYPCGHPAASTSECPTWAPVEGCRCRAQLGRIRHPTIARLANGERVSTAPRGT